ncbi:hypothetical protein B0H16DRAFT_167581 [Mycena metata]|uniref:Uncharacterized protein n=1 Tax=Mycena metata TaxID=1033252 RepID=A0AAD7JX29_9AGAR|nr:hypothetical protein B0H16DRAFT_167581 [Mycena metata]
MHTIRQTARITIRRCSTRHLHQQQRNYVYPYGVYSTVVLAVKLSGRLGRRCFHTSTRRWSNFSPRKVVRALLYCFSFRRRCFFFSAAPRVYHDEQPLAARLRGRGPCPLLLRDVLSPNPAILRLRRLLSSSLSTTRSCRDLVFNCICILTAHLCSCVTLANAPSLSARARVPARSSSNFLHKRGPLAATTCERDLMVHTLPLFFPCCRSFGPRWGRRASTSAFLGFGAILSSECAGVLSYRPVALLVRELSARASPPFHRRTGRSRSLIHPRPGVSRLPRAVPGEETWWCHRPLVFFYYHALFSGLRFAPFLV